MGLTVQSTSAKASRSFRFADSEILVALAGNPNVGKSTVFNELTGMKQHTGNWPGKTVALAKGVTRHRNQDYTLVDLPGTYSLIANSAEEAIASEFICFDKPAVTIVVCDATALQRNLNLVLQILQMTANVVVCVNLMDEAQKKNITLDLEALSRLLHVPVVGASARSHKGLNALMEAVADLAAHPRTEIACLDYPFAIQNELDRLRGQLRMLDPAYDIPWIALQILNAPETTLKLLYESTSMTQADIETLHSLALRSRKVLDQAYKRERWEDLLIQCPVEKAQELAEQTVTMNEAEAMKRDRQIDKILFSRWAGVPLMILLLCLVLWITLAGANVPSQMLAEFLFSLEAPLAAGSRALHLPEVLVIMLSEGMYRVLAWVVAVMLPPMAIFFPLFTYLEDLGYLPRVAFNLDKTFAKAHACGKQALTTCMGFGCNAAGVIGCRIIDSPRERLIAILTNNFAPCNGRFPTLISILTMFFLGSAAGLSQSLLSALLLTLTILLGLGMTFLVSRLLSATVLKGVPSSFTLELPPYRRPQLGKVLVRSVFDRTLFVLGRAITVAAPAGILLWVMANTGVNGQSLLAWASGFLDPLGRFMGLDGVILIAFILGFPANEIVIPIIIMAYLANGSLIEMNSLSAMKDLFLAQGWTLTTAVCTLIFVLFHWPCSTTCLTIYKETKSLKWTLAAIAIPTVCGILCCSAAAFVLRLF